MTDARTDRINAVVSDLADLLKDAMDRMSELADLEVPQKELSEIFTLHSINPDPVQMQKIMTYGYTLMGQTPPTPTRDQSIRAQVEALFAEGPTPIAGTSPALPDVVIALRGFPHPISGVLAKCPNGCLKIAAPAPPERDKAPRLIEHFFTYDDVLAVIVTRELTIRTNEPTLIIQH